ncbi:hypothetical protein IZT72_26005 [Pseudomonas brenneri]|uniref:JAB domain-containing protein n=1 Tax=Pseudomonas brenneri TaxID=129817 RepID=UPI0018A25B29|nr:hypothetical protein [Pseudomonas brenneri]
MSIANLSLLCGSVLVHSHPPGNTEPSVDERHLANIFTILFVQVGARALDHIIVGSGEACSFAE